MPGLSEVEPKCCGGGSAPVMRPRSTPASSSAPTHGDRAMSPQQGPVQAALNMLPEAAAYCRYTGVEGTAEVTVNNKLQALLSRGAAAEAHPGPEATGTEGEREGATGTGGDGEMGAGPGGSACLPLEVFLGALLGPHTDEGEQFFEECRRGRGTLRRRLAGAGPASGDITRDWLGVGRTWEAAVEAAEEGQTWIVRDVTAEASLEERLSIVSSCSPSMYFFCEGQTVRECSASAGPFLGFEGRQGPLGEDLPALAPPEQPDGTSSAEAWEEAAETARSQGRFRCRWTARRCSGECVAVEMRMEPVEAQGKGLLAVFWNDLTETRQREEELREAVSRAEKLSQSKSLFLANMSHEIRTPMNGVIGVAELLLQTELTAEQRSYLEIIQSSGDNLLRIISDVLDLSKIESQSLELEAVEFNILKQVTDAHALLTVVAEERGLQLTMSVAPDVPSSVIGDPVRIRQVLLNLMSNAVKFTPSGTVSVSLRLATEDEIAEVHRRRAEEMRLRSGDLHLFGKSLSEHSSHKPMPQSRSQSGTTTNGATATADPKAPSSNGNGTPSEPQAPARRSLPVGEGRQSAAASASFSGVPSPVMEGPTRGRQPRSGPLTPVGSSSSSSSAGARPGSRPKSGPMNLRPDLGTGKDKGAPEGAGLPRDRAMLRFEVADTGVGIPEEAQAKLFQPFTQADSATTRKFGGTGLGLAICKLLVQLMGGTVGLSSKMGEGSKFFFYVDLGVADWNPPPPKSDDKPLLRTRSEDLQAALKGIHVLVAEDNKVNQLVAMRMLKHLGIPCDVADNGLQAIQSAAAKHYDLILMDCHMPVMDGFEATRMIRQAEAKCAAGNIPVPSPSQPSPPSQPQPQAQPSPLAPASSASGSASSATSGILSPSQLSSLSSSSLSSVSLLSASSTASTGGPSGPTSGAPGSGSTAGTLSTSSSLSSGASGVPAGPGFATRTVIVALTASALSNDKEKCLAAGMDSFLSKPIRPADLQQVIGTHLAHLLQRTSWSARKQKKMVQQVPALVHAPAPTPTPTPAPVSMHTRPMALPLSRPTALQHDPLSSSEMEFLDQGTRPGVDSEYRFDTDSPGTGLPVAALQPRTHSGIPVMRGLSSLGGVEEIQEALGHGGAPRAPLDDDAELSRAAAQAAAATSVEVAWGAGSETQRRRSRRRDASKSLESFPFDVTHLDTPPPSQGPPPLPPKP